MVNSACFWPRDSTRLQRWPRSQKAGKEQYRPKEERIRSILSMLWNDDDRCLVRRALRSRSSLFTSEVQYAIMSPATLSGAPGRADLTVV
ncbi:hypothetical protein N7468_002695 [Penicillium chermesinum]|uniref:Uncharacterized protein n=1 Tax=Penicillium chermesinum TaxID=63820 RepID=A0A9W9PKF7_9EURO|nr:uncharacterized protein N7468_002695 [Penicillium chermesinum]KAJ5247712.1 hypothetical protein N7468_002695 [Penicillium chermesinum]